MFIATQGLSFIPVLILIAIYSLFAVIVIIPIMIAIYCYRFACNMLYLARCSKEEFAKGELITSQITGYVITLVAATIILIAVCCLTDVQNARLIVGLIYCGVVIIFGGLLALIIIEKVKCGKYFDTLDEDLKQNYLAHENALRSVKSRLGFERRFWNGFFR